MTRGLFITLEGPDGSGKTSVANCLKAYLQERGFQIVHTREPGGVAIAEEIRNVILKPENTNMDPKTEALLYAASRRQHLVEKVLPALQEGKIVLCERFVDSSLAYQGFAREIGMEEVMTINSFAIDGHMPDITLFLDIDAEIGLKRIANGRVKKDRLDAESLEFHQRVAKGYREVLRLYHKRMTVIDASQDIQKVVDDCFFGNNEEVR